MLRESGLVEKAPAETKAGVGSVEPLLLPAGFLRS